MKQLFPSTALKPGDCILYRPADVFDCFTAVHTWTWVSHVECYIGGSMSVASRNGLGVNRYVVRLDHVAAVLRPGPEFQMEKALHWFYYGTRDCPKAIGQKYGWRTLLSFLCLNSNPIEGHMICSEFAANWYAQGDCPLFNEVWPAYRTAPATLLTSAKLEVVWEDGSLFKSL